MPRKKKTKSLLLALIVGIGIILFWRGVWQLTDTYLFPNNYELSNWISLIAGLLILLSTNRLIKNWLYE